jgi:hypothetical protein
MRRSSYFFLLVSLFSSLYAQEYRILPVRGTPESDTVTVVVAIPKEGAVVKGNPVWMQIRVDGFALAADSQFERKQELANTDMGQTVHVVVDNQPYFPVNGPAIDPFNEEGFYYDTSYKFEIPFKLSEGMHTLRVFPARTYGESLKGEKTFFASTFYVGEKGDKERYDLSTPFLTYNEPSQWMRLTEEKPVLLDFYISNCEMTPDGYTVRLTIDGKFHRTLTSWQPYYIYGLKKGRHTLRLELLKGKDKKPVKGPFNDVERTITIH